MTAICLLACLGRRELPKWDPGPLQNWSNKIVVVTGGTAGLGKAISLEFARSGASVITISRNPDNGTSLQTAAGKDCPPITCLACDVTQDQEVADTVAAVVADRGQVDVWVNCAGASTRADIRTTGVESYRAQMEINFYSTVRCSLAILEQLARTSGHLVNIGSLASKTAWPFMAPYSASKHAVASFTHQLRLEGPANVNYLLVCPGPIRREDAGERYDEQSAGLPDSARLPGGGAKLKGCDAAQLARQIRIGCEKRKLELVLPWKSRLLFGIAQVSPRIGDWLLKKFS